MIPSSTKFLQQKLGEKKPEVYGKKQSSNKECMEKSSYLVYKLELKEVENRKKIVRGSMTM